MLAERGIHSIVDNAHAAGDGRRGGKLHDRGTDHFGTGDQAQSTFDGKWQHKPQRDDAPKQNIHPLGSTFQNKPQYQHGQNQPACGNAQI